MKLDNKLMIQILKEEYDKRIVSFLDEVETKAKYQKAKSDEVPLIQSAKGLKVLMVQEIDLLFLMLKS